MTDPLQLFETVLKEFKIKEKWDKTRFERIKIIPNTSVGNVGQCFIEKLCEELEIKCVFPVNVEGRRLPQSPWDIAILGIKFELKTATQDINGKFQFNHVRYHREYQALLCLGVSPANLYFRAWSKADTTTGKAGKLVTMEKGANASFKLTKSPEQLLPIISFKAEIENFCKNFKT